MKGMFSIRTASLRSRIPNDGRLELFIRRLGPRRSVAQTARTFNWNAFWKHPKEPDWPEAEFIVGNPPFLGGKLLRTNLGGEYVDSVLRVWDERVPREADHPLLYSSISPG